MQRLGRRCAPSAGRSTALLPASSTLSRRSAGSAMTVEKFQSIRFQARTSETIKRANEIIAEYDARVLTLLQQSRELLKTIGLAGAPPGSVARSRPDQGSLAERYPREWRAERRPANGNKMPAPARAPSGAP
jgi:hypothetical protein